MAVQVSPLYGERPRCRPVAVQRERAHRSASAGLRVGQRLPAVQLLWSERHATPIPARVQLEEQLTASLAAEAHTSGIEKVAHLFDADRTRSEQQLLLAAARGEVDRLAALDHPPELADIREREALVAVMVGDGAAVGPVVHGFTLTCTAAVRRLLGQQPVPEDELKSVRCLRDLFGACEGDEYGLAVLADELTAAVMYSASFRDPLDDALVTPAAYVREFFSMLGLPQLEGVMDEIKPAVLAAWPACPADPQQLRSFAHRILTAVMCAKAWELIAREPLERVAATLLAGCPVDAEDTAVGERQVRAALAAYHDSVEHGTPVRSAIAAALQDRPGR